MKTVKFFLALLLCLLPSLAFSGTANYVDCNADNNGNGSYASPWNNITSINSHSFSAGDDVYFKVNTTCTLTANSDRLQIDWGGTSGDRVIIGAYYGNGQFGLNGNPRPILDGDGTGEDDDGYGTWPSANNGIIDIKNDSYDYITIQDLKFQYSNFSGVYVKWSDNINVDNCYFYRGREDSIVYGTGVNTGIISDNTIENQGWNEKWPRTFGAGANITLQANGGTTTNITVTRNKIFSGKHEGIGLYQKADGNTVEYNVVRDLTSHHIYIDAAKNNIIRYNLIYQSDEGFNEYEGGIVIDNEKPRPYCYMGNNEAYGNLIAGMGRGFSLGCQEVADDVDCACFENTKIYNNTLVDNVYNIRFWAPHADDSLEIKNNIFLTKTAGSVHSNNYSPIGVTWSHNSFDESVSGDAATNAVIGDPALKKSSGWRSLPANSLDGTEFSLLSGSKAINAGISIASYNNWITASDYSADPIMVMTSIDSQPDIGAWIENAAAKARPRDSPTVGF